MVYEIVLRRPPRSCDEFTGTVWAAVFDHLGASRTERAFVAANVGFGFRLTPRVTAFAF